MSYRGQCPNCGKVLVLGKGEVGRTAVCGACGTRFAVRLHEPPAAVHGRSASPDAGQALHATASDLRPGEAWGKPAPAPGLLAAMGERPGEMDVPDTAPAAPVEDAYPELAAAAAERPGRDRPQDRAQARRAGVPPVVWVGAAAAVLIAATIALVLVLTGTGRNSSAALNAENMRRNADLIAVKSDAEALAAEGKLNEAHEKYRELFRLAAGREVKAPLLWDMMERAKADQDRIYQLVLNRIQAQDEAALVAKGLAMSRGPNITPGTPGGDPAALYPGPWAGSSPAAGTNGAATANGAGANGATANGASAAPNATEAATPAAAVASAQAAPAPSPAAAAATPQPAASPTPPVPATSPATASPTPATPPAQASPAQASPVQPSPAQASPAGPPQSQPAVAVTYGDPQFLTDEEIGESLQRGVDYLLAQFNNAEIAPIADKDETYRRGLDALCVYALLTAGQSTRDPRLDPKTPQMKAILERLRSYPLIPSTDPTAPYEPTVYARSFRAAALSVYNRPEDRNALKNDVEWLIAAHINGAYTYDDRYSSIIQQQNARPAQRNGGRADAPAQNPARRAGDETLPGGAPGRIDVMPRAMPAEALLLDDGSAPVIPVDGWHDANGREMGRGWPRSTLPPVGPRSPFAPRPPGPTQIVPGGPPRTPGPITYVTPPRVIAKAPPPPWTKQPPLGTPATQPANITFPWDNSNSQYGLLGVWSGAEVGVEVPTDYWRAVQKHWTNAQLPSGEWSYRAVEREPTHAMTTAGIASLFVTHDWLDAATLQGALGRDPLPRPLAAGLGWLEQGDNAVSVPGRKTHYLGYDLYGLERVALASGFKYFGKHDWYREMAAKILQSQFPNGSWGREDNGADSLVDTAYMLLFLSRGRHPVIMNKLRFDGDEKNKGYWANRPRDLANLARYVSRKTERTVNWQVVNFERDATDWLDSPILYIASHKPPPLSDAQYEKLRQFVEAGGMIFTHADGGSMEFTRWVQTELVKRVANKYELRPLPEDHDVYSLNYKIKSPRPKLLGVDSGSRLLLVHSPEDMASIWQQRSERVKPTTYELAANLFFYASGKAELRNRLASPYLPPPKQDPKEKIKVARLKYAGSWDPEPGAWARFARWMQWDTSSAPVAEAVAMAELKPGAAPVAHLTGNVAYQPTDAEVAAVKAYVEAGGVLLIDVCGGMGAFGESVEKGLLPKAFPGAAVDALKAGDAPLKLPGLVSTDPAQDPAAAEAARAAFDLSKPRLRVYAAEKLAPVPAGASRFKVLRFGKGAVIYSPLDLTTGLLGSNTWGNLGYHPDYATAFVRNLLMWATSPDRDAKPAATQPAGG